MACSTCNGSGDIRVPVPGTMLPAHTIDDCPECSASAMRAQRDEARAEAALWKAESQRGCWPTDAQQEIDALRGGMVGLGIAATAQQEAMNRTRDERDEARAERDAANRVLRDSLGLGRDLERERDTARAALAALLDALPRCINCERAATCDAESQEPRCFEHEQQHRPGWAARDVTADAIEAAERVLGRRP